MILKRAISITRAIWRDGPWIRDFFGAWNDNEQSECHLDPRVKIQGPPLQMAQVMDIARFKIIKSKGHVKNGYIGNSMYMSFWSIG